MVNSTLLKSRAKEMGITQREIAAALELQQSSLNLKLNNARPMKLDEAEKIAAVLKISDAEFSVYFFASGVA